MALKRLKVKMTVPAVKAGDIPVVGIEGDLVAQYNAADKQLKAAKAVMDDLKPEILEVGLNEIFSRSCRDPINPTPTVKLQDDSGKVLRVEFTKRYGQVAEANLESVEDLFEGLKGEDGKPVDINTYLQETVDAEFDSSVFLSADGTFQQRVYDEFRKAIEAVSKRLGVDCPLNTKKVVTPKEKFHVERFHRFPDPGLQMQLSGLIPNTNRIVPVNG
jgi:hypothetical protein